MHTFSPYLILNKEKCQQIMDYKELKLLIKYCKNFLAPEETIFTTLIFNLDNNLESNKFTLALNNDDNVLPLIPDFQNFNDFLFMRRFQGNISERECFEKELDKIFKK